MSSLGRRITALVVAMLLALAAVAWFLTYRQARGMSGMVSGLAQIGGRAPNDMNAAVFMGMWITMMVAMMFPTIAPFVLAHRMVVRKRGEGPAPTVTFVLGYLAVWSAIGLFPLAAFVAFRGLTDGSSWLAPVAGGVLVVAGVYQFTPWKSACLRACRTPMSFLVTHDFGTGARGAFLAGVSHGAYCLGCCWALMAVLVVVGLMNLAWMALISLVFLAEKNWRHGVGLTRVAGGAVTALGAAVIAHPSLVQWIGGASAKPMSGGM